MDFLRYPEEHSSDGLVLTEVNMIFTGEYKVVDWFYAKENKNIKDYQGKAVYRDGDGKVQTVWVSMFSPDGNGDGKMHSATISANGLTTSHADLDTLEQTLKFYTPGQKWDLEFVSGGPELKMSNKSGSFVDVRSDEYDRQAYMVHARKELVDVFIASLVDENKMSTRVPEGMVITARYIFIILEK